MNAPHFDMPTTFDTATQRGAVLVISLLILLLLTIIGITAMRTTTMEEKMAGNMRDQNLAFQAAEAALRDGESRLSVLSAEPSLCTGSPCTTGLWDREAITDGTNPTDPGNLDATWWSNANHTHVGPTLSKVATAPRWVIEYQSLVTDSLVRGLGPPTGRAYYRVTARATGGSDTAQSILQTTYAKRFN